VNTIELPYPTYAQISKAGQRWLYVPRVAFTCSAPMHLCLRSTAFQTIVTIKTITRGPSQDLPEGSVLFTW